MEKSDFLFFPHFKKLLSLIIGCFPPNSQNEDVDKMWKTYFGIVE
jgi:hypothetical protein